jgi:hypothetical protein
MTHGRRSCRGLVHVHVHLVLRVRLERPMVISELTDVSKRGEGEKGVGGLGPRGACEVLTCLANRDVFACGLDG